MENYKEIARRFDEKVEQGKEAEGLVPVEGKVSRNADVIYSMRFTRDEIALLRRHAEAKGMKLSEFLRSTVLDAARREQAGERSNVAERVREQVRELAETVRRL